MAFDAASINLMKSLFLSFPFRRLRLSRRHRIKSQKTHLHFAVIFGLIVVCFATKKLLCVFYEFETKPKRNERERKKKKLMKNRKRNITIWSHTPANNSIERQMSKLRSMTAHRPTTTFNTQIVVCFRLCSRVYVRLYHMAIEVVFCVCSLNSGHYVAAREMKKTNSLLVRLNQMRISPRKKKKKQQQNRKRFECASVHTHFALGKGHDNEIFCCCFVDQRRCGRRMPAKTDTPLCPSAADSNKEINKFACHRDDRHFGRCGVNFRLSQKSRHRPIDLCSSKYSTFAVSTVSTPFFFPSSRWQ